MTKEEFEELLIMSKLSGNLIQIAFYADEETRMYDKHRTYFISNKYGLLFYNNKDKEPRIYGRSFKYKYTFPENYLRERIELDGEEDGTYCSYTVHHPIRAATLTDMCDKDVSVY